MLLAATHRVTGLPALLILLVILVLLVAGAVFVVRGLVRGGKKAVHAASDSKHTHRT